jgi:hypothetical protein
MPITGQGRAAGHEEQVASVLQSIEIFSRIRTHIRLRQLLSLGTNLGSLNLKRLPAACACQAPGRDWWALVHCVNYDFEVADL